MVRSMNGGLLHPGRALWHHSVGISETSAHRWLQTGLSGVPDGAAGALWGNSRGSWQRDGELLKETENCCGGMRRDWRPGSTQLTAGSIPIQISHAAIQTFTQTFRSLMQAMQSQRYGCAPNTHTPRHVLLWFYRLTKSRPQLWKVERIGSVAFNVSIQIEIWKVLVFSHWYFASFPLMVLDNSFAVVTLQMSPDL